MNGPQAMSGPETMSAPEPASAPEAMSAPESMSGPDGTETACAPEITGVTGTNSSPDMGAALAVAIASQNGGPELVTPSLDAQDQWSTDYTLV